MEDTSRMLLILKVVFLSKIGCNCVGSIVVCNVCYIIDEPVRVFYGGVLKYLSVCVCRIYSSPAVHRHLDKS